MAIFYVIISDIFDIMLPRKNIKTNFNSEMKMLIIAVEFSSIACMNGFYFKLIDSDIKMHHGIDPHTHKTHKLF